MIGVLLMTATIFPAYCARAARRVPAVRAVRGHRRPRRRRRSRTRRSSSRSRSHIPSRRSRSCSSRGHPACRAVVGRPGGRVGLPRRYVVRTQLAVLFPVLVLVLLARAVADRAQRRWRATWSAGRLGRRSRAPGRDRGHPLRRARPAVVQLVSRHGVLRTACSSTVSGPPVRSRSGSGCAGDRRARRAGPARDEPRDERTTTFVALRAAAILGFGLYTAIKAAASRRRSRSSSPSATHLPLSAALRRPRAGPRAEARSIVAVAAATAFVLYSSRPRRTARAVPELRGARAGDRGVREPDPALGRRPDRDDAHPDHARIRARAGRLSFVRAARRGRRRGSAPSSVAWSLTTEIYARERRAAGLRPGYANLPKPPDWVDRTTGGSRRSTSGRGGSTPTRPGRSSSGTRRSSGSGGWTGARPAARTPNLLRPDGTQDPDDLNAGYALG